MTESTKSAPEVNHHVKGQLAKRSVVGSLWMMCSAFSVRFVKLFVFAIMARLLTPRDFGFYAGTMMIFGVTEMFVGFGLGAALIQRKEIRAEHVFMSLLFCVCVGITATVLIYSYAEILASFIGLPSIQTAFELLSPICILQSLSIVPRSLIIREMRFSLLAKLQFATFFFGYGVVGLTLSYLGLGYWALMYGFVVQQFLSLLLINYLQSFEYKAAFSLPALGSLLRVGSGFALGQTATALGRNGDYFMTGRFLGEAALGVYSRAYGLMETAVGVFITASKQVLLPIFSAAQDNNERLRDAMRINLSVVFGLYIVISVIAIVVAEELILVLLGPQWGDVVLPFQILCIGMCFRAGWKISTTILVAKGASYRAGFCQVIYALLVLVGAFFGSAYDLPGIAVGVLIALGITFCISQMMVSSQIDFPVSEYVTASVRTAVLIAITGMPAWSAAQLVRGMLNIPLIVVVIATATGVFGPLLLMAFRPKFMLDAYLLEQLEKFLKRFSTRAPRTSRYLSLLPLFTVIRTSEIGNDSLPS